MNEVGLVDTRQKNITKKKEHLHNMLVNNIRAAREANRKKGKKLNQSKGKSSERGYDGIDIWRGRDEVYLDIYGECV